MINIYELICKIENSKQQRIYYIIYINEILKMKNEKKTQIKIFLKIKMYEMCLFCDI